MNLSIRYTGGGTPVFTGETDAAMQAYLIPGSRVWAANEKPGKLLLQEITFDGYSILYSVFNAAEDCGFIVSSSEMVLLCHITAGRWKFEVKNTGYFRMRQGQYCLFFNRFLHGGFYFKKGRTYSAVTIYYPVTIFLQAIKRYPRLHDHEARILKNEAFNIGSTKPIYSVKALQCIDSLLHAPFAEAIKGFHTSVLHKLLFLLLQQLNNESEPAKTVFLNELDKVYAAKAFIDARLPQHLPIHTIAMKAGMNEQQLKRGFKAVFGKGVYGYYQEQVLAIARKELEETGAPVKAIALRAGYKSQSNFRAAFKKYYGVSPGRCRGKG